MMNFQDAEHLFMLSFLSQQMPAIKKEYLKHKSRMGYVLVKANKDFQAFEHPTFIQRGFNKHQFKYIFGFPPLHDSACEDNNWIYYEIFWGHSRSSWYLKQYYQENNKMNHEPWQSLL